MTIHVSFRLKMSLKSLEEKSAKKDQFNRNKGAKVSPMQNKVNQHPFTENVIIQNWFEVSNQNSGYCSGSIFYE